MKRPKLRARHVFPLLALAVVVGLALFDLPVVSFLARMALVGLLISGLLLLGVKAYQAFLWRVSRRLAFSYFLIGVVPIPMLALLLVVLAAILASFFLGHLQRSEAAYLATEMRAEATARLAAFQEIGRPGIDRDGDLAFAYYRNGRRIGGSQAAPVAWPGWILEDLPTSDDDPSEAESPEAGRYVLSSTGEPTLVSATGDEALGVLALLETNLATKLTERTGAWISFASGTVRDEGTSFIISNDSALKFRLNPQNVEGSARTAIQQFFDEQGADQGWWGRGQITWLQINGPLFDLTSGNVQAEGFLGYITATPQWVTDTLFARTSVIGTAAWGMLAILSIVLLSIYAIALAVALFMIFGLSRAVNRLSGATGRVRAGDFSVRIPVRRRDQIGALQRNFNDMAVNLQSLVAEAATKEVLEKELAIAREIQQSLLPSNLPGGQQVEFATLFKPSAAIGGDYFDILRLGPNRLAVVIADVSGHGLSSGLRMAMLKAALLVLIEEEDDPEEILRRLDQVVRANREHRFFVTATLAFLDLSSGRLDLVNAGHPPTYLVRDGEVEEILLPGSPLGGIEPRFGKRSLELRDEDRLLWLSDGLIEAESPDGEVFGYDRIVDCLRGVAGGAVDLRQHLVAAVEAHAAGTSAEDDRTLVVMRYNASVESESPKNP